MSEHEPEREQPTPGGGRERADQGLGIAGVSLPAEPMQIDVVTDPAVLESPEFAKVVDLMRDAYRYNEQTGKSEPLGAGRFIAACRDCIADDPGPAWTAAATFFNLPARDAWARKHAEVTGHQVTLAEQHHETGTTLQGVAMRRAVGRAERPLPLVAFIVPEGGQPDLMCRVPERSGASWLVTAAHACLIGKGGGSAGVARPHVVMMIGRILHAGARFEVSVDGVFGATGPEYGKPIGARYAVSGDADPATVEDTVEELIAVQYGLARHLFSVVLMADPGGYHEPPDPHADAALREQRRAARERDDS